MKKLLLSFILASIAATSFGMESGQAKIYPKDDNSLALYATLAAIMGGTFVGLAGLGVYSQYLASQPNNSDQTNRTNWKPYAKIATGLGFAGLSAYLGLKERNSHPMVSYTNTSDNSGLSLLSPNLIISGGSTAALASLVPAYFFMKSGFDDLRIEKKALQKLSKK